MEFNEAFLKHAKAVDANGKPKQSELTQGLCYYWAHVFSKIIGGKCVTFGELNKFGEVSGHMMILWRGKYYDADHETGIKSPPIKSKNI